MDIFVVVALLFMSFCITSNLMLTWIVIGYANTRPLLRINIMDGLSSDLLRSVSTASLLFALIKCFQLLHISLTLGLSNALGWYTQFQTQITMIYVSWGVVLRYVYVHSLRMILEDIMDDQLQNIIRLISIAISILTCGLLYLWLNSLEVDLFLVSYLRQEPVGDGIDWGMVFVYILGLIAISINVSLRLLIRNARHLLPSSNNSPPEGQPSPSLGYGAFFGTALVVASTAPFTYFANEEAGKIFSFWIIVFIPASIIVFKSELRKYAACTIVDALPLKLRARCESSKSNSVHPDVQTSFA